MWIEKCMHTMACENRFRSSSSSPLTFTAISVQLNKQRSDFSKHSCCTNLVLSWNYATCSRTQMLYFLVLQQNIIIVFFFWFCSRTWACVLLCRTAAELCTIVHGATLTCLKFDGGASTPWRMDSVRLFHCIPVPYLTEVVSSVPNIYMDLPTW